MRKTYWVVIGLLLVLALAACGGDKDKETPAPEATVPGSTVVEATPLPPTWTALPPDFVASPVPPTPTTESSSPAAVESGGDLAGGTPFPPTWTPGRKPTVTPRYTYTPLPPTLPNAPTWTPLPDYCQELQTIGPDIESKVGEPVIVQWTPIEGITTYRVELRHPGGGTVLNQVVTGTQFVFDGSLFTVAGPYGWGVWPQDGEGNDICYPAGAEIVTSY